MNDKIRVATVADGSIKFVTNSLMTTRAHAGKLLATTKDFEGYEEVLRYVTAFEDKLDELYDEFVGTDD